MKPFSVTRLSFSGDNLPGFVDELAAEAQQQPCSVPILVLALQIEG
jgi:hypothetical protein